MMKKLQLSKYRYMYLMAIPVLAYYILFSYVPMYGIQIAFKDYNIFKGIWDSKFVGFNNFRLMFEDAYFWKVTGNTLIISFYKILFSFPVPVLVAMLLNELRHMVFKRTVQTIIYLPRFISWVIMMGILGNFLSINGGLINVIIESLGGEPVHFLVRKDLFRILVVVTDIWKGAGWGSILYLAAISGINPEMYEAAAVDGAGKLRQAWHVTLPGIRPTITMMLILALSGILNAGFDQIFVMYNDITMPVADIIDTYVFRSGLQSARYSYATAVGLFKSVISLVLIFGADRASKALGESGLL